MTLSKPLYAMRPLSYSMLRYFVGVLFLREEGHKIYCDRYLGSEINRTRLGFQP